MLHENKEFDRNQDLVTDYAREFYKILLVQKYKETTVALNYDVCLLVADQAYAAARAWHAAMTNRGHGV